MFPTLDLTSQLTSHSMITSKTLVDMSTVPKNYHDFVDIFNKFKVGKLADHWPYNQNHPGWGISLPYGPIYSLSQEELVALCKFIYENRVNPSLFLSHWAPVLFIWKKDSSLWLCVNFQVLNQISKKDWYPLPLILPSPRHTTNNTSLHPDWPQATHIIFLYGFHLEMNERLHSEPLWFIQVVGMPEGLTNAPTAFKKIYDCHFHRYDWCHSYHIFGQHPHLFWQHFLAQSPCLGSTLQTPC